jgi:hypothetical protein
MIINGLQISHYLIAAISAGETAFHKIFTGQIQLAFTNSTVVEIEQIIGFFA